MKLFLKNKTFTTLANKHYFTFIVKLNVLFLWRTWIYFCVEISMTLKCFPYYILNKSNVHTQRKKIQTRYLYNTATVHVGFCRLKGGTHSSSSWSKVALLLALICFIALRWSIIRDLSHTHARTHGRAHNITLHWIKNFSSPLRTIENSADLKNTN